MGEHEDRIDWPHAVTNVLVFPLFLYRKLNRSSKNKLMLLLKNDGLQVIENIELDRAFFTT